MPPTFRLTERTRGEVAVLALEGHFTADEEDAALLEAVTDLERAGVKCFLLDLSRINFIDSGAVGSLVSTSLHVTRRGGQLKLLSPSSRVVRIFEMTQVGPTFEIFSDEAAALASFARPMHA